MTSVWRIFCDDAQLAVECARSAEPLGLTVAPTIEGDPIRCAAESADELTAIALATPPSPEALVALASAALSSGRIVPIALIGEPGGDRELIALASDLGLVALPDVAPSVAAMALISAGAQHPWTAATRKLSALDRTRLGPTQSGRGGGRFEPADDGMISWRSRKSPDPVVVGAPAAVGEAFRALHLRTLAAPPARAEVGGVDLRAVHDVIFGPPRALSDPASKIALQPYGLPLPLEELCSSPSRAAAEAARIGFPVRISLASPDLRIWDHPDLAVDGVDNAARVRDVYRQVMALASERQPDARLLGVHVTATTAARALLKVVVRPLPGSYVHAQVGFADPHGLAARDQTVTALPAGPDAIERVLARLAASELLLGGSSAQRKATVASISDVLLRLAAFVEDHREEIVRVELHPLAVLLGGGIEAREACVTVGDAFLRTLEAPRIARRGG